MDLRRFKYNYDNSSSPSSQKEKTNKVSNEVAQLFAEKSLIIIANLPGTALYVYCGLNNKATHLRVSTHRQLECTVVWIEAGTNRAVCQNHLERSISIRTSSPNSHTQWLNREPLPVCVVSNHRPLLLRRIADLGRRQARKQVIRQSRRVDPFGFNPKATSW